MSKKIYLFSLVLLSLAFASCEETKEEGKYDNWRARNEAFIDEKKNTFETTPDHGGLSRIELISAPGDYIYYKVKTPVPSEDLTTDKNILGKNPTFTATVKLYYKGTNILEEYFDGNFIGNDPVATPPEEKKKRDANVGDSTPREFTVSDSKLIAGWQEVLQKMKVGERWEVYIPWEYGYGSSGNDAILGYSTLVFDIQLLDADSVHETEAPKQNK